MSPYPIAPVRSIADRFQDNIHQKEKKNSNHSISKVKELVLERIGQSESRSGLLPSATAPRVLVDLLSTFAVSSIEPSKTQRYESAEASHSQRANKTRRPLLKKGGPIGLKRKGSYPFFQEGIWINPMNALMQFVLFLPGLCDLFFFAPKSFYPFQDFIDQYRMDQQEGKSVSSANTPSLVRCMMKYLPSKLFKGEWRLYEILQSLIYALFPAFSKSLHPSIKVYFPDSIAFHPEWQFTWESKNGIFLDEWIQKKCDEMAPELLISVKGADVNSSNLIKRQFFTPSDWFCYDLDAFIEKRPDRGESASYVTYLKIDGGWHQCDDDRISPLRSNSLNVPLCRSILLHYKKIEFGRLDWGVTNPAIKLVTNDGLRL